MNEYKIQIEYGRRGIFCFVINAPTMEDAVRTAMTECVPPSFADKEMTGLSAYLSHDHAGK